MVIGIATSHNVLLGNLFDLLKGCSTFGRILINKNIHTCERSAIKIDGIENFQDIFQEVNIFSPFGSHSEYLAQFLKQTFN